MAMSTLPTPAFSVTTSIAAPAARVWAILLDPNAHWACAFGEGTVVECDWREGSPIVWRDGSGNIGASGVIEALRPNDCLQLRYHDEAVRDPEGPLGDYVERFTVSSRADGTLLQADIGAIPDFEEAAHQRMWETALRLIKAQAEAEVRP